MLILILIAALVLLAALITQCPVRRCAARCAAIWLMRDPMARIMATPTRYGLRCAIISRRGVGTIHWDGWRMRISPGTFRYGQDGRRPPPRWW